MGFRPKQTGNVVGFRRWHHANIETDADTTQKHTAGTTHTVEAGTDAVITAGQNVTITAGTKITLAVGGSKIEITAAQIVATAKLLAQAGIAITGTATANNKNIADSHTHTGVQAGPSVSGPVS